VEAAKALGGLFKLVTLAPETEALSAETTGGEHLTQFAPLKLRPYGAIEIRLLLLLLLKSFITYGIWPF